MQRLNLPTEAQLSMQRELIADLERELAECKAALAIERECPPEMKDYALTYRDMELERDALAAQVVQMREALKAVECLIADSAGVIGLHLNGDSSPWSELRTGGRFEEWLFKFDEALALNTKPAKQIIAKVKAEALREATKVTDILSYGIAGSDVFSEALRRMADELE